MGHNLPFKRRELHQHAVCVGRWDTQNGLAPRQGATESSQHWQKWYQYNHLLYITIFLEGTRDMQIDYVVPNLCCIYMQYKLCCDNNCTYYSEILRLTRTGNKAPNVQLSLHASKSLPKIHTSFSTAAIISFSLVDAIVLQLLGAWVYKATILTEIFYQTTTTRDTVICTTGMHAKCAKDPPQLPFHSQVP